MKILSNLTKCDDSKPSCIRIYMETIICLKWYIAIQVINYLQDREAHSSPFHVSPSPEQVPAGQKVQLRLRSTSENAMNSSQASILQSNPHDFFLASWHTSMGAYMVKPRVLLTFELTWCCIRTHSLFISVKFWSTNSTASITVFSSLEKQVIHPFIRSNNLTSIYI